MIDTERSQFNAILNRLGIAFSRDVTPQLGEVYWQALRDLALSTLEAMAQSAVRYGRFFPKPRELRPSEDTAPARSSAADRSFTEGEARAFNNLEELRLADPAAHLVEVRKRLEARRIARGERL